MSRVLRTSGVDRTRNPGAMVSNEIVLWALQRFLEKHYGRELGGHVLDLGAGRKPYAPLYKRFFARSTSVDVPQSMHDMREVDVLASADDLPFADGSFDCVICTEVLEHCPRPQDVMLEIARVLKSGGRLFLTTPFLRPLHELPNDYYRYTPPGLHELASSAGLQVRSISPKGEYVAVALAVLLLPVGKAWYALEKITGFPVSNPRNPLVFLTVLLPQYAYLAAWRRIATSSGPARRLYDKLSYFTLGYVTEIVKPHPATKSPTFT